MTGLYPTKTRLALLRGVRAERVTGYPYYDSGHVDYCWVDRGRPQRITARIVDMLQAGWVCRGEARSASPTADFVVALTEVGRRVLEVSGG
jgi:hypothetical protein